MRLSFPSVSRIVEVVIILVIVGVVLNAVPQARFLREYMP